MPSHQSGPIVPPGVYQVKVTLGGQTFTQPLTLLADPKVPDVPALEQTYALQLRIRDDVGRISNMVNLIERERRQLEDMKAEGTDLARPVAALNKRLQEVEYEMFQKALAASDDKYYVAAFKIYFSLLWLNAEVGTGAGDVAGGADLGPTDTAVRLVDDLEKQLRVATGHYETLMARDVPAFNELLAAKGKEPLVTAFAHEEEEEVDEPDEDAGADPAEAD